MGDSAVVAAAHAPLWVAPAFDGVPPMLRERPLWVLWRAEPKGKGKVSKVPYQPNGRRASSTDPKTWSTFDECRAAHERWSFNGIGFVLDGQPLAGKVLLGIDVDKVKSAQVQIPALRTLLEATYSEPSPSGTGTRAFVLADEAVTVKLDGRDGWPGVEIYTTGRYLTVTGQGSGDIAHEAGALAPLLKALRQHPARRGTAANAPTTSPYPCVPNAGFAEIFPPDTAATLAKLDPAWNANNNEFSAGIPLREPAPLPIIGSALMHLAAAGRMAGEGEWKAVAMAMGRCAYERPCEVEALWSALDAASRCAGGSYDEAENRKHFDRFMREAATRGGRDDRTILHLAHDAGWQQPTPVAGTTHVSQVGGPVGVADLPVVPSKRQWLHGTDIMRGAVSLVVAPGGRGKSALLIGTALALASGRDLMGSHVFASPGGLRVLYGNNEDGADEISRRVRAAMRLHGLADADCAGLMVAGVEHLRLTLLRAEGKETRSDEHGWDKLERLLDEHEPDVLILDPLANLSAASLNDNHAATILMSRLTALAVKHRIGIVVAHHTAKGRDLSSQEAASGAAAIVNSARISIALEPLAEADAAKIGVMPSEAWRYFCMGQAKGNLAPPGVRRWFKLESVDLGNAQPPIYPHGDSVQVVVAFKPNPAADPFPPEATRAALQTIRQADPPLSPSARAPGRHAIPVVATAIAPHLQGGSIVQAERAAKAIIDRLVREGRIQIVQAQVPKAGRGTNSVQAYAVVTTPTAVPPALPAPEGTDTETEA